jgi:hypothetical protein
VKVKPAKPKQDKIVMKTGGSKEKSGAFQWWLEDGEEKLGNALQSTAAYIKENQVWRLRQLAVNIRLYCGLSVYSYAGSNMSKLDQTKGLPDDRPTFNLIQSITDTIVSRIGQQRPVPVFLTDNSDYKERHVAQQLNGFVLGEFYNTKAYEKGSDVLRDGCIMGTGAAKVYEDDDKRVAMDRVLITDLYHDVNDAINGDPQVLYQFKLMERERLMRRVPAKFRESVRLAPNAFPDNSSGNSSTSSDQVMVIEAWKNASSKDAKDGRHVVMMAGVTKPIINEVYEKTKPPFVFFTYSKPFLGFWGQGVATRQFGTQLTLNRILYTIARAITLVGVPRVFQEMGSKVMTASNNNEIGVIVKYSGTKPSYEVAPCNAPELYSERDRLIQYGYQSEGVSFMQATSTKPQGLDSGEAIRANENIATDRMSQLSRKFDNFFIDLAYLMTETAVDIAKRDGKYTTVFPNKDGTKEIDLPKIKFLQDPFTIQCYSESMLPKEPAGRMQKVVEMVQAGMVSLKEGRRLMNFPDLGQMEKLSNASEERIFKYLDDIIESGKYTAPDPFMDLVLAEELTVQYYNLYAAAKLEADKEQKLRTFHTQIKNLQTMALPPQPTMPGPDAGSPPQAVPAPLPQSPLVPNAVAPAAA